jgi:hypothetical protein
MSRPRRCHLCTVGRAQLRAPTIQWNIICATTSEFFPADYPGHVPQCCSTRTNLPVEKVELVFSYDATQRSPPSEALSSDTLVSRVEFVEVFRMLKHELCCQDAQHCFGIICNRPYRAFPSPFLDKSFFVHRACLQRIFLDVKLGGRLRIHERVCQGYEGAHYW